MKQISSTQNEQVKHVVKLQNSSYRKQHQQFITQGLTVYTTLLAQGYKLVQLYLTESALDKHQAIFKDQSITLASGSVMKKISTSTTPSGIVGIFEIPKVHVEPSNNAIVLYDIQDPGNMGTLIRTAAAMSINNIYLIDGADPYSPKVIQATAGTIGFVKIIQSSWDQFIKEHAQFSTTALVVDNGQAPDNLNLADSILVIGNEGQGLSEATIRDCSQHLTIEMPGKTESLNAAVAGSIAMYLKTKK